MATLLSAATANGAGTGASHTGPCTLIIHGDSVFDGAMVQIEIADTDTSTDYTAFGLEAMFKAPQAATINGQGTYFLRARISNAGPNTSITCVTIQ